MKEILTQEPQSISVTLHDECFIGTVQASIFTEWEVWYLNRLLVSEGHRGNGVGSKLLSRLREACAERRALHREWPQVKSIIVEPGGYGSDTKELLRFYKGRGFEEMRDPTCLVMHLR